MSNKAPPLKRVEPQVTFELIGNTDRIRWGRLGRRHLLESLCAGHVHLDSQVLSELQVKVKLPDKKG
jgi:hypothetical protein